MSEAPLELVTARFWEKVQKTDNCWLWTGGKNPSGYGQFRLRGRTQNAQRAAWVLARGEIPKGIEICHRCDNRECVNPDHLFLGTHAENMRDMFIKGRHRAAPQGSRNHKAKITESDVVQIRASSLANNQIAQMFGITNTTVSKIRRRERWKHI